MNGVETIGDMLGQSVKRVLVLQGVVSLLLLLGIVAFYGFSSEIFDSEGSGFSALMATLISSIYGSVLAISGTILSARSIRSDDARKNAVGAMNASTLLRVYSGLLNKLVIVGGGIGFGLIVFGLDAIFVVGSYFIVQIAVAIPLGFSNS